jgi:hypothetical protein
MRLEDTFIIVVLVVAATIGVPWLIFALASLFEGFPRLRLHQILGIVGVSAWVFGFMNALGRPRFYSIGPLLFFTSVGVLLCFAGMWTREFRLLMLRRAEEFTEPSDKRIWIFILTVMAPAGVWLFRSYRKVRWPDTLEAVRSHPLDEVETIVEVSDMTRIGA